MRSEPQRHISFAEFDLDTTHRRLTRNGEVIPLYAKTYDLLLFLLERNGQLVTKDEILEAVWAGQFVEESNLTVQISALRKALGDKKNESQILLTIPGKGYKFAADLKPENDEIIIQKHTISQITIEEETEIEEVSVAPNKQLSSKYKTKKLGKFFLAGATILILGALTFGFYRYFQPKRVPFQKVKLTRLTNNGNVLQAAISPDGKYVAYVLGESEGNSLWMRQIGTASDIRLLPAENAEFWGLTFSPDGAFIYYNLYAENRADLELHRIPSLGGFNQKISDVITNSVTFSPDGKRLAFIVSNSRISTFYLVTADIDGQNQKFIYKTKGTNNLEFFNRLISWSPDGKIIACSVNNVEGAKSYSSIIGVNVDDGTAFPISRQPWFFPESIEWMRDGSGLLISAANTDLGKKQGWFISYPDGEARQIISDLNDYGWINADAKGENFVSVQINSVNSISVGELTADAKNFTEINSETGGLAPLVWTPDSKIIHRSSKDGIANFWQMDADGNNKRQLTSDAQIENPQTMCISPDGKYLVFSSRRSGKFNLWRVNTDGGNLSQLTFGESDLNPRCSPDGNWVVYQENFASNPKLWKVPLMGGEPTQIPVPFGKWAAISNDGKRISFVEITNDKWQVSFVSADGKKLEPSLPEPSNLRDLFTQWSPDDKNLLYIGATGSVGNIWAIPLDGKPPTQITHFPTHFITGFSLAPDGKKLAVSRSLSVSDVVLISNETN